MDEVPAGRYLESFDPATGELVGRLPRTPPEEVEAVAAAVAEVQPTWARAPLSDRLDVIGRAADRMLDRREELSLLFTRESGKPITESSIAEVGASALVLSWVARHGRRHLSPERVPTSQPIVAHKKHWVVFDPLGVIGVIGPWNYPCLLPMADVAFALAAGNGVVFKPSELTPLSGQAIADLFAEAGLPEGVLRVVHGEGDTGAALCEAGPVQKILFTGSVESGRKVLEETARAGKMAQLELGGNDPAVVCADADLERAVAGVLWASCANAGQTCAAIERVYVDRRIHDRFVAGLVAAAETLVPGDPKRPDTQIGPIISERQHRRVLEHLEDARRRGATVECGGPVEVPGLAGLFVAPAVLTGVDHSMRVMREETFGPLIPVMAFDDEREALALANDSEFGLGASVWTRDARRGRALALGIEAGMVWINDHAYSNGLAEAPWGGVKSSGTGVAHSRHGLQDMTQKRLIAEDAGRVPAGWWFPYSEIRRRGFLAVVESLARARRARRVRAAWDGRGTIGRYVRSLLG
ncbi:MAG TPA: aldehyde dehydrogenase family protein [Actinomycetota bacterium]